MGTFNMFLLQDQDGALNSTELEEVFSTSPGNPWSSQRLSDTTLSDETGAITLQGWLAQWRCVSGLFSIFPS